MIVKLESVLKENLNRSELMRTAKSQSDFEVRLGYKGSRNFPTKVGRVKTAKRATPKQGASPKQGTRLGQKAPARPKRERAARVEGEPPRAWKLVLKEFRDFLCTDSSRYADLRRKINSQWRHAKTGIVGAIAAAIGSEIGFAAAVILPAVPLALAIFIEIGKRAFCARNVM